MYMPMNSLKVDAVYFVVLLWNSLFFVYKLIHIVFVHGETPFTSLHAFQRALSQIIFLLMPNNLK